MISLSDKDKIPMIDNFCQSSLTCISQLEECLDKFEDSSDNQELTNFSEIMQKFIKTTEEFDLKFLPTLLKLGEKISHSSSMVGDDELLNVVSAVLYDLLDANRKIIAQILDKKEEDISDLNLKALQTRFVWIAEKLKEYQLAKIPPKPQYDMGLEELYSLLNIKN
jgi:hypothetical protein